MSEIEEVKEVLYNPYKRKLTAEDEEQIRKMMAANPVIDRLIAETIVLMPSEDLKEICDKHKAGTLEDPYPNKEYPNNTLKTGKVLPEEE